MSNIEAAVELVAYTEAEVGEKYEIVQVSPYGGHSNRFGTVAVLEELDSESSSQPYYVRFEDDGATLWVSQIKLPVPPRDPNELVPYSTVTEALLEFRKVVYKEGMEAKRIHGFCNEIDSLLRKLKCTPKVTQTPEPGIGSIVGHATDPGSHPIFKRRDNNYGGSSRWTRTGTTDNFTWDRVCEIINGGHGRPSQVAIIFDSNKSEDYDKMTANRIIVNEEWV